MKSFPRPWKLQMLQLQKVGFVIYISIRKTKLIQIYKQDWKLLFYWIAVHLYFRINRTNI